MSYAIEEKLMPRYKIAYEARNQVPFRLERLIRAIQRRLLRHIRRINYYIACFLPKAVRNKWNMITYQDIFAVSDCSGFQYGD